MRQNNKKKMFKLIMMLKFTLVYSPLWKHCSLICRRQLERVKSFLFLSKVLCLGFCSFRWIHNEKCQRTRRMFCESQLMLYKRQVLFQMQSQVHDLREEQSHAWIWQFVITVCTRTKLYGWIEVATTMGKIACGTMRAEPTGPGSDNPFASLAHFTSSERTTILHYP
jgi:hypothetical protein